MMDFLEFGSDTIESPCTLSQLFPNIFLLPFFFITHVSNLQTNFWTLCTFSNHQAQDSKCKGGL